MNKLNAEKKEKISSIQNNRQKLSEEIEKIRETIQDTNNKIVTLPQDKLVTKRSEISDTLFQLTTTPVSSFVIPQVSPDFTDQIELRSVNAEFVIDDFESVRHSTEPLYSRPLHTNGLEFKLKVYPCGNEMSRGVYVSVFLQLSSSVPGHRSSQYTYQIQMKNQSGSVFEREFTSEFEAGECWGYNRFFQLDRLDQYIEHNQLRFIFYVRATSYATQQRDLNNYVKHLEGLIEQQNESDVHEESSLEQHPLEVSHNLSIDSHTSQHSSDLSDDQSEGEVRGLDTQELLQITSDTLEGMDMNTQELLGISDLENSQFNRTNLPREQTVERSAEQRNTQMNDLFDSLTNFPSNEH